MNNKYLKPDKVQIFDDTSILFQRASKLYADKTAILYGNQYISYTQLNAKAEVIKDCLNKACIPTGSIIAVIGKRSPEVIASALAVWLAKCTLMLIDESLPAERQEQMLKAVPTRMLISCSTTDGPDNLPAIKPVTATSVDSYRMFEESDGDYAYIAFTSGSTGIPKAIVGSHNGLAHFLMWQASEFSIGPGDRFAQFTNLSFDVWFRDVFTPLICGATVCISVEAQLNACETFEFIRQNAITAMHIVPSIASLWINYYNSDSPINSLKHSFFAGEPLGSTLIRKWDRLFPESQIINLYGPTETTLAKHFMRLSGGAIGEVQPVGSPIDGAESFIINEEGEVCAPGEIGEICISTPYRSHGYFIDGELVSPFVSGVISSAPDLLVYQTGDIGRRNNNNEVEILGRQDDQIKINGVRIDPGEIKFAIMEYTDIRNVFVCARNTRFTKHIVAFVEADECSSESLLYHLRSKLPSVMVPADVRVMKELPRLPNGKLDRKQLSALANKPLELIKPDCNKRGQSTLYRLETIWQEILERPELSKQQNFFDVGGNSLLIISLHERIQKEFNVDIPIVRLFQFTTIQAQAELIEGRPSDKKMREENNYKDASNLRIIHRRQFIAKRVNRSNQVGIQ